MIAKKIQDDYLALTTKIGYYFSNNYNGLMQRFNIDDVNLKVVHMKSVEILQTLEAILHNENVSYTTEEYVTQTGKKCLCLNFGATNIRIFHERLILVTSTNFSGEFHSAKTFLEYMEHNIANEKCIN